MENLDKFKDKESVTEYLKKEKGFKTVKEVDKYLHDRIPNESYYQKKIMDYVKKAYPDAFVWKEAAGEYSRQGIPDVSAIIEGRYFGFEVKRPYFGKISVIQEQTIKRIRQAGGIAGVCIFPEDAERLIQEGGVSHCQT